MKGVLALVLVGCCSLAACDLDLDFAVSDEELISQLGPRSVTYARVEKLVDPERFDKSAPDFTVADNTVNRALRRQDFLGVRRAQAEATLKKTFKRERAAQQLSKRVSRAAEALPRLTLPVHPDEDYELIDGEAFVRGWNRLVRAEHEIIRAVGLIAKRYRRAEALRAVAIRAAISDLDTGGGARFTTAARRWYLAEQARDKAADGGRYDTATGEWDTRYEHLSELSDADFISQLTERYPESFLDDLR